MPLSVSAFFTQTSPAGAGIPSVQIQPYLASGAGTSPSVLAGVDIPDSRIRNRRCPPERRRPIARYTSSKFGSSSTLFFAFVTYVYFLGMLSTLIRIPTRCVILRRSSEPYGTACGCVLGQNRPIRRPAVDFSLTAATARRLHHSKTIPQIRLIPNAQMSA